MKELGFRINKMETQGPLGKRRESKARDWAKGKESNQIAKQPSNKTEKSCASGDREGEV